MTINTAPCPTITLPASLPNGKLNTLYIQSAAATPSGSYSYQVTGGSVPPGITFYGAIGLLYGYPTTNGSYTFTITATNNNNCMSSKSYTVTISNTGIASAVVSDYDGDEEATSRSGTRKRRTGRSSRAVMEKYRPRGGK